MPGKQEILEREQRWRLPAGIAAVAGVALIIASFGDSAAAIRGGEGAAARLADVQGEHGKLIAAGALQLIGWLLLAFPLAFLFKAAAARTNRMRTGLIGVVVAAPILLGAGGLLGVGSVIQASDAFVNRPAEQTEKCVAEKVDEAAKSDQAGSDKTSDQATKNEDKSGKPGKAKTDDKASSSSDRETYRTECEDEAAQDARSSTSLSSIETVVGLSGLFGFTLAVAYTALWALRTGLLSRFWGALGVALGAVFVFFTLFTLSWFIYVGLLLAGWVPGGRPPAWAAGKAVEPPQPKGGGLFGPRQPQPQEDQDGPVDEWGEPIEGTSDELEPEVAPEPLAAPDPQGDGGGPELPRRKRKKRNG